MQRYLVKTFGCQMNVHDSERMHEVFQAAGLIPVEDVEHADLVVLNTCSVREKAEQKLRSLVGTLAELKAARPEVVIAIAGCMAQEHGQSLLAHNQQVDLVVGPDHVADLPALAQAVAAGAGRLTRTSFDVEEPVFLRAAPRPGARAATAYVTVMKGCDERCSFCIVPYTRGPERYRPSRDIVEEIGRLVDSGVREVTLLGQTVNSYRDPAQSLAAAPDADPSDPDESEFAALLHEIARSVPRLARLRYASPHPRHVTSSLIRAHRELDVLASHVHLPVQSGSDRVLKRMIRRYTRQEYVERTRRLLASRAGLSLSTDVIVGFPGETHDDFLATLELVREIGFKGLFGFKYSPRPHTPALRLDDDVPEGTKSERLAALFELSEALLAAHLESLVGQKAWVLVEGPSQPGSTRLTGRTERNEIVHIEGAGHDWVGATVEVRIRRAFKHSLEGEILNEPREHAPAPGDARRRLPLIASRNVR